MATSPARRTATHTLGSRAGESQPFVKASWSAWIPAQGDRSATADGAGRPNRIALYSHDSQGLGHVRRNSLVAAALVAARPDTDVLLLAGAPEATALPLPPRTDVVTVPPVRKRVDGRYCARAASASLDEVIAVREAVILAALSGFAPDLLIVDKVALGLHGELERALLHLRKGGRTRTVLGLRDILDDPQSTAQDWAEGRAWDTVNALYDEVWVYGDPHIFDPAVEYGWPKSITDKVTYTGYLARGRASLLSAPAGSRTGTVEDIGGPFVLCLIGGGEDGASIAAAFANATFPAGHTGVLITGPYLDPEVLEELAPRASEREDLLILGFVADVPSFVDRASATVSMAGYNSVCELLSTRRPALLVPRIVPRVEQALRAERLGMAGLVDVMQSSALTTAKVTDWLSQAVARSVRPTHPVDLDGFNRLPDLAARLLGPGRRKAVVNDVAV